MEPQSLSYGFLNKIMDHPVQMGVPEVIGSDVPYLMMDVPNFVKDVQNVLNDVPNVLKDVPIFFKDAPRVPKCVPRWGSAPNHFLMSY